MRKIKFRAWEGESLEMIYPDDGIFIIDGNRVYPRFLADPRTGSEYEIERVITRLKVMQYTNFDDKNGKEIYELDILKDGDDLYMVYQTDTGMYQAQPIKDGYTHMSGDPVAHMHFNTVNLGSTFENPELIKQS
jgi:uncharacterized phage protein (TIGR01671 family)